MVVKFSESYGTNRQKWGSNNPKITAYKAALTILKTMHVEDHFYLKFIWISSKNAIQNCREATGQRIITIPFSCPSRLTLRIRLLHFKVNIRVWAGQTTEELATYAEPFASKCIAIRGFIDIPRGRRNERKKEIYWIKCNLNLFYIKRLLQLIWFPI